MRPKRLLTSHEINMIVAKRKEGVSMLNISRELHCGVQRVIDVCNSFQLPELRRGPKSTNDTPHSKHEDSTAGGCVYIAESKDWGSIVKIGRTSNLKNRKKAYHSTCMDMPRFTVFKTTDPEKLETEVHRLLNPYNVKCTGGKEFFSCPKNVATWVIEGVKQELNL